MPFSPDEIEALRNSGTALAGRIQIGSSAMPALYRRGVGRLWPEIVQLDNGAFQFAVDGYLVRDGRLALGESHDATAFAAAFRADPTLAMADIENGSCNLVAHDAAAQRTILCSDAAGCLPLYLHRGRDAVSFANDLPGLRAIADGTLARDQTGCAALYWFGYQIGSRTVFRDVTCIPPSAFFTIDWQTGGIETAYWANRRPAAAPRNSTPEETAADLVATMQTACRRLDRPERRFAMKLSGGMDSRLIAGTWPTPRLPAFTFTAPGAIEFGVTRRLARAMEMPLGVTPIEGDFFSRFHAPIFGKHAITEFFHQALIAPMIAEGIDCALDGLGGDVLFGGLALKRKGGIGANLRNALGIAGVSPETVVSDDQAVDVIFSQIRVADGQLRILTEEAQREIEACRNDVLNDIALDYARCEPGAPFARRYRSFAMRNRMRRYIALQGAVCRPEVETLYPFLDRDVQAMAERIGSALAAGKKFYRLLYRRNLPKIAGVPFVDSLLPPAAPNAAHVLGRLARYGMETAGYRAALAAKRDLSFWRINSVQWPRWIAFDSAFQDGIGRFMRGSAAFSQARFAAALDQMRRGNGPSGTRMMLTASYLGTFDFFA
jgi:asparagine synthetase B (glutamine-hydrolysing)